MLELQFLEEVKKYIEDKEVDYDYEWGSRTLEQLIKENKMPKIYDEVLKKIKYIKL